MTQQTEEVLHKQLTPAQTQVEDAQSPYGWAVSGISKMFCGPYAEYDARTEANHCGGTAEAFPLFKHGPYSDGEPIQCVFEDPHDDINYSALIFKDIDAIECLQDVISHYNDEVVH